MSKSVVHVGRVESFDVHRGTGVVVDDGGDEYPFHCTAISDGTRDIEPGTRVSFEISAGLGRWEAITLAPA